ncbi:MAG: hypothetical protein WCP59_15920 [Actinomycetota bacterium]
MSGPLGGRGMEHTSTAVNGRHFSHIVVGAGALGSAAAYRLNK